jgi:hypothetical protein
MTEPLSFGQVRLASLLGPLTREANAVCILQSYRSQLLVLVVVRRH